ncbi:cAMP-dependent protein kinase type II regulatory subunit-like [Mercenaria mercenaria]|uniref:cAMP-dependent protein kinase type II regulatory subunit-like n=1 Tax=Mercenaria mercenaria TaxID=6596 RepID=UPI001E1D5856|nr:cAMP-dependent protein kinase type II regulatory subunit-like [Mercenaria mercenaria]XP_045216618.1 cAMP-dependent protein kinase type II regulatory subunit-like [Mercenaria mercenaria]XP_045216619.1 cAMP-dependent protein kinase type II regulatory subunit-like [Mercenaria mercenaria]XP_045216620.1 cAMP-dependent protein kinase type II regulatory subunit-like [Mercenaria mercenaria]XP_045216621.1 cAMP-dependent protein kinase type II regulatory subunit-like [Mercenaria mercenaria]XP_0452166
MNLEIPDGLGDLLRDFTVAVLRDRPADIYDFAVGYFTKVRENRRPKAVPMYVIVDDDEDASEPDKDNFKPKCQRLNRYGRRQSVSAERYDPEEDDDDEEKTIHAKTDEQRDRLTEAVSGILLFRALEPEQMQDVLDAMFETVVNPGDFVIRQGDDGDNFYVIDSGRYDVTVNVNGEDKKVHTFEDKGSFGELALLYNMPRSASVMAVTRGSLWAMDRNSFRRIVLKSAFKKRKMYEELLENVPILKSLEHYERSNLADALMSKTFKDGVCIIRQGNEADGMFFLEKGVIRVTIINPDGDEEELGKHSKGKYFGELALIENQPRSANVYAVGDVKVAFLERESFERLLGPCLDIMKRNSEFYKQYTEQHPLKGRCD